MKDGAPAGHSSPCRLLFASIGGGVGLGGGVGWIVGGGGGKSGGWIIERRGEVRM